MFYSFLKDTSSVRLQNCGVLAWCSHDSKVPQFSRTMRLGASLPVALAGLGELQGFLGQLCPASAAGECETLLLYPEGKLGKNYTEKSQSPQEVWLAPNGLLPELFSLTASLLLKHIMKC